MNWQNYTATYISALSGAHCVKTVRAISEGDARYTLTMPCKRNGGHPVTTPDKLVKVVRT